MISLRLTRSVRDRHRLADSELPGQIEEIRRLLAQIHAPWLDSVNAGQVHGAWIISAALSLVIDRYRGLVDRQAVEAALSAVDAALGPESVDSVLRAYAEGFDAGPFATREQRVEGMESVLLLWLANVNPAFGPMRELFDDASLIEASAYEGMIETLSRHFEQAPPFGPDSQPLVAMLRTPAELFPDSLAGQLAYIREHWASLIGDLLDRLLLAIDLLSEEDRAQWLRFHGDAGLGRRHSESGADYDFRALKDDPAGFTVDRDWHPRLVLIAKSAYVWLDQLSRVYGRDVHRLDQVPDEELDRLASWGMTGLWLIGIWQRSRASEEIKRRRGNPEAAASAYALDDYRVADDLGGEAAWLNLSERAGMRGLRLAADMVPNHMGIDSRWVIEHPEWFLSLAEPPYPGYSFNGPDLSPDSRVSIVLEDHYWDNSDAAVVFQRRDRETGDVRYIYHGNDGTSFPWNDTAQLNYLDPAVRSQVIATILDVARHFPIVRFDAAMVLTRKHIQRLWWPEPGSGGGAIPSRAERTISSGDFHQGMPAEFWREVVDSVAAEGLDTLLLAEAFWLLEGYFVRTLGMHRVYNSAFMHMLRDERNAEYHLVMRNTMELDPEVLRRYVNFMSNPDEATAVEQFGRGDKYLGVCTLLATLPGLPMFGHGQVEGFAEKYGMEYRRAYHDESVDQSLIVQHDREIFPLLRRRSQFAEVRDFLLYDFVTDDGWVNRDVFAYSNGSGTERSLVIYHNRYGSTSGVVREADDFSRADGSGHRPARRTLANALGLFDGGESAYVTFRDNVAGLEYLRSAREVHDGGIWVALGAYGRHVFLDFQDVRDGPEGHWGRLRERMGGQGVPSLADAMDELILEPVRGPFSRIVNATVARKLLEASATPSSVEAREQLITSILEDAMHLADAACSLSQGEIVLADGDAAAQTMAAITDALSILDRGSTFMRRVAPSSDQQTAVLGTLLTLVAVGAMEGHSASPEVSEGHIDQWRLAPLIAAAFRELDFDDARAWQLVDVVRAILGGDTRVGAPRRAAKENARRILSAWLTDENTRRAIGINTYDDVEWLRAEQIDDTICLWTAAEMMRVLLDGSTVDHQPALNRLSAAANMLRKSADRAEYRVDALMDLLTAKANPVTKIR